MKNIEIKTSLYKEKYKICYKTLGLRLPPFLNNKKISNNNFLYIGHFNPGDNLAIVKNVSEFYTKTYENVYENKKDLFLEDKTFYLNQEIKNKQDILFGNYIKRRFINYKEFINVMKTNFRFDDKEHPSYYYKHEAFPKYLTIVLGINTYSKFQNFTNSFSNDLEGYKNFLLKHHTNTNIKLNEFINNETIPLFIQEKNLLKSVYVVGQSGSGKSELLKQLIHNQFYPINHLEKNEDRVVAHKKENTKDNIILIEPHGDLSMQIARLKENYDKKNVILLDPFLDNDYNFCINPFDIVLDRKKQINELNRLTNNVVQALSESFRDPTDRMTNLLKAYVAVLLQLPDTSILDLRKFLDDDPFLIEKGKKLGLTKGNRRLFNNIEGQRKRTKNSLIARLEKLLGDIFLEKMLIGKSTLNLENILNNEQGKLIILRLSTGDLGSKFAVRTVGKLFLGLISGIAYNRSKIPEYNRITTHVYVDEFHDFITNSIFDGLTALRKFKVFFYLASQTVGQNINISKTKKLLGNTQVKIIGDVDDNSRKKLVDNTKLTNKQLSTVNEMGSVGKFALQIGNHPGIIFQAKDDLLGFKHAMKQNQFNELKQEILDNYYINIHQDDDNYSEKDKIKNKAKRKNKKNSKNNKDVILDDDMLDSIL